MAPGATSRISTRNNPRTNNPRTPDASSGNPRQKKITRRSIQLIKNCLEYGFQYSDCCSGCQLFYNRIPIEKKHKLIELNNKRDKTHTNHIYLCRQPWKKDPLVDAKNLIEATLIERQLGILRNNDGDLGWIIKQNQLFQPTPKRPTTLVGGQEESMESTPPAPRTPALHREPSPSSVTRIEITTPKQAAKIKPLKESYAVRTHYFMSNGHEFAVENVPLTHTIVPLAHLQRLRNAEKQLSSLRKQFCRERFPKNVSELTKTSLAIALTSAPGLALKAAQYAVPVIASALLQESGVLNYKGFKPDRFARSFPSEFFYRNLIFDQAAKCCLLLGRTLQGMTVFLSCDKGNKKGVGHFVKMLSYFDQQQHEEVQCFCLDMDASEGSSEACATAVVNSLRKVGNIKLQGSTTDSGGGGVLEGLSKALAARNVCLPNYKTAACSIHAFQLTLANPTKQVLGEGSLGAKNLMQTIHSIYDLQEALEFTEFVAVLKEAVDFVKTIQSNTDCNFGDKAADKTFESKMKNVMAFYKDVKSRKFWISNGDGSIQIKKMPAPVLTRWWYVGEGCKFVWQHYLPLLKATQIVINVYPSSKQNKIASNVQPLLQEPVIFSDLAFLKSYHNGYFNQHMKWLQASTDLSNKPGFQSFHTFSRYFLMHEDLLHIKETIHTTHPSFKDYRESLVMIERVSPEHVSMQKKKANMFVDEAISVLRKHFRRWAIPELLPAALLSESSLANAVARVIQGFHPIIPYNFIPNFQSIVHDRVFDMARFGSFLLEQSFDNATYDARDVEAAQALTFGAIDFRDNTGTFPPIKDYMWRMYVPLASHTQFVEAAVKEAKLVSPTGRHEPLRSAYAITRSHLILPSNNRNLSSMPASKRALQLLESAHNQVAKQEATKMLLGDEQYDATFRDIRSSLNQDHFKGTRLGKLAQRVHDMAHINRKENKLQQSSGVDYTMKSMGMIPFSSVTKVGGYEAALKAELKERHVEFSNEGFAVLKKLLAKDETDRLKNGSKQAIEAAKKAFMPLSQIMKEMA